MPATHIFFLGHIFDSLHPVLLPPPSFPLVTTILLAVSEFSSVQLLLPFTSDYTASSPAHLCTSRSLSPAGTAAIVTKWDEYPQFMPTHAAYSLSCCQSHLSKTQILQVTSAVRTVLYATASDNAFWPFQAFPAYPNTRPPRGPLPVLSHTSHSTAEPLFSLLST